MVLRQPFGGVGKSAIGPGIKAGGPDYVTQFMTAEDTAVPPTGAIARDHRLLRLAADWQRAVRWGRMAPHGADLSRTVRAVRSYLYWHQRVFGSVRDFFHLRGQDNLLRYLPVGRVIVRLHPDDTLFDALARIAAARICRCRVEVSLPEDLDNPVTGFLEGRQGRRLLGEAPVDRRSDRDLIAGMERGLRLRYAAPDRVPGQVAAAAAQKGMYIAREPVLMEGRLELLHYLENQSICHSYHRYGNLGDRGAVDG